MLEKLLLAATVTLVIHFILPAKSLETTQMGWENISGRRTTTTEVANLVGKKPSLKAEKFTVFQP